jgi:predicted hydrocarbon binding protein
MPSYDQMKGFALNHSEFIAAISEQYKKFASGERIRPTFGDEMQILYMRDRQTFLFLLFPELKDICYQVGKIIGEIYIGPTLSGTNLPSIMKSNVRFATEHKYAYQEVVESSENFAVYRSYECADCYGMPNIGQCICVYEAGTAAGGFSNALGKTVEVNETKCCANGDPYCEFEVRVLD